MKIKNIFLTTFISAITLLGAASCESDIDKVFAENGNSISLNGTSGNIILSAENPQALVMTLYWSGDGKIALSDTLLQAPVNIAEETIQFAKDENFTTTLDISVDKGVRSYQFLCADLNSMLSRLNYEANELTPLYIRIRSSLANNVEPQYSDVLKVNVQTYRVVLNVGRMLDKDWNETGQLLASPSENGIYEGFLGVGGWTNWYMREANNIVWGNLGESGRTFWASSNDSKWNFWFPAPSGCYYTTVNTVAGWWSALYIESLTVSGDVTGEMTYNQKANQWLLPVESSAAKTISISINGVAHLYDKSTTDMGPAIDKTVAFGGNSTSLTFGETGSVITVDVPAGKTNLVLDLSDPFAFTIKPGDAAPDEPTSQYLYFSGLVTWDGFDDYLSLYDESGLCYGGAHYINSEWGYRAYPEQAWDPVYTAADGSTAFNGQLVSGGSNNIPAPEAGLYVMDFKLSALTYSLTKVTSVTYAGLNNDWSEKTMAQSESNPEIFTAEFTKTADTPWGVKVLINNDWSLFFGGGSGLLKLGHSDSTTGFDGDNDLTIGETYILTVDLGKQTYSYSKK